MAPEQTELRVEHLQSAFRRYLALLREYQEDLNRLNVYPVPDGDTGTNMMMTVGAVVEVADRTRTMAAFAEAIAHGSLMDARGNSGIILSQILRAFADTIETAAALNRPLLAQALLGASDAAYAAVGRPVEGTILTVLRDAAETADGSAAPTLAAMMNEVYRAADDSLRRTPELLPVLAEAGVVDAGGAGLLLMLAAFAEETTGVPAGLPEDVFAAEASVAPSGRIDGGPSVADLRYEVMFLLDGAPEAHERLRDAWADIGDSIVIVGGDGTWNCHIHTDHLGAAIEAGIEAGRPHRLVVTDLLEQAADERRHHDAVTIEPLPEVRKAKVGMVAVAAGEGLMEFFRESGAQGIVPGGQTMNPSVGDLLDVVESVPAKAVVVLPNNKNIVPAAEQLDSLTKKSVWVVPTTSIPEGIAAAVAYVAGKEADDFVPSMVASASLVTTGELTRAVRDARTPAGNIRVDDWLGLVDGKVSGISPSGRMGAILGAVERLVPPRRREQRQREREEQALLGALIDLLERTVGEEAEIVTVVCGVEADVKVTTAATEWLAERRPLVEAAVIDGGQPLYPYLIGVE